MEQRAIHGHIGQGEIIRLGGEIPSPAHPPAGCHFHPRCPFADARCCQEAPLLRVRAGRSYACHRED